MRAVRLRAADVPMVQVLLEQAPNTNLFLLDLLRSRGIGAWKSEEWYGVWRDPAEKSRLDAIALIVGRDGPGRAARLAVPFGDEIGCVEIGVRARWSGPVDMLIGPRLPCDAFWRGIQGEIPKVCYNQRLYVCAEPSDGPQLALRRARLADVPDLIELAGQMMLEDLGVDPRQREPARHRLAVRHRVEDGRTLLGEVDGSIAFILDVGTCRREGAQVGGTFVPPRFRGRGLSVRGMRSAVTRLLREVDAVSLHVNEANIPAVRCYERVGFQRDAPFRLLIR